MVKRISNASIKPTIFAIIIGVFFIKIPYISQLQKAIALIVKAGIETEAEDLQVKILRACT